MRKTYAFNSLTVNYPNGRSATRSIQYTEIPADRALKPMAKAPSSVLYSRTPVKNGNYFKDTPEQLKSTKIMALACMLLILSVFAVMYYLIKHWFEVA